MESKLKFTNPSRFDRAFCLNKFTFGYILPVFYKGYRHNGLDANDIDECPSNDRAEKWSDKLERSWKQEMVKSRPKFWWALVKTFWSYFIIPLLICLFMECVILIIQPLALGIVIRYFSGDKNLTYQDACLAAAAVVGLSGAYVALNHPVLLYVMRIGMRMRTASCSILYRKILRLSRTSMNQTAVGQIINIMSNDVNRMDEFCLFFLYLLISPLQLPIIIYIVYQYLEISCFAGIGFLFLLFPFQALMGRLFARIRMKMAILTDKRLQFMSEIISGIRVIKMYAWESSFAKRVADVRYDEVMKIRQSFYLKAINLSVFFVSSRIVLFICFITYVMLGNNLTSEAVFVSMSLVEILRITVSFLAPRAIGLASELMVTCRRIEKFLLLEENQTSNFGETTFPTTTLPPKLVAKKIVAKWNITSLMPTLNEIDMNLEPGDLLAVIGPVGSGKSSLLMAILKELSLMSGSIEIRGSIAYAGQDSWLFNETIRNNILFGMKYDEQRYRDVVKACALERDLLLMPFGDRTLVGDKGVSLSGGQKARINLARAVYRDMDILLLDDPLSAVDTAVAEHIFDKCLIDYLRRKIRILVTHQIQFIQKATKILILKEGHCLAMGTFNELNASGIDFMSLLTEPDRKKPNLDRAISETSVDLSTSKANLSPDSISIRTRTLSFGTEKLVKDEDEAEKFLLDAQEEQFQSGSINSKIYWEYAKAGAAPKWLILSMVFTVLSQGLYSGSDIFLTDWANKNQIDDVTDEGQKRDAIIYTIMILALFVSTILRSISIFIICMRASVNLHNRIFERLLCTRMAFFDSNPIGRILNRFTKDLGIIDEALPNTVYDLNLCLFEGIGVIIVTSFVSWYMLFPAVILSMITMYFRSIYIKSARDIKRLEGVARSPVFSHVNTTMVGLTTIRAFGVQKAFERKFFETQNDHTAIWFLFISSSRCIGWLIDWISVLYVTAIAVTVMLSNDMLGGYAGLAFSSGLVLAGMTQWLVRQSVEFESQMTSVERIIEYQNLEQETSPQSDLEKKPSTDWPNEGCINFDHVFLTYPTSPKPVLKDLNFQIAGGEKIGIVGRTGAGKSSIISALFRLVEPEGVIKIDQIDTKSIGLKDLRRKISIIPQDPVVFTGSVRYNLDPFNEYPEDQIWAALEEVRLKAQVNSFPEKLEAPITEGGSNLSVGQRQLICLARAILKNNRILVMDEATANVDHQTDNLIQETIRTKFKDCTVLTIAHRLNTIIDCDRIMVLDAGRIAEFDIPYLLFKRRGTFYDMCKKTGHSIYTNLYNLARISYKSRQNKFNEL